MMTLAQQVIDICSQRGVTLACSESLTAGLVAATLAEVPGASVALRGGVVVYATELKHSLSQVPAEVLARYGPVSAVTARYMAEGVRGVCGSDIGLSCTGVAGPATQDGHPVGEVWIGVASEGASTAQLAGDILRSVSPEEVATHGLLHGRRGQIREHAVQAALVKVLSVLREQNETETR